MLVVVHLRDLNIPDFSNRKVSLQHNVIYLGKAISDIASSILYSNLPIKKYKHWLKSEIEAKTDVYENLAAIKQQLINNPDASIFLVCDCHKAEIDCQATTVKRAIMYLVVEEWAFGYF